jgi:hypothetical protein
MPREPVVWVLLNADTTGLFVSATRVRVLSTFRGFLARRRIVRAGLRGTASLMGVLATLDLRFVGGTALIALIRHTHSPVSANALRALSQCSTSADLRLAF